MIYKIVTLITMLWRGCMAEDKSHHIPEPPDWWPQTPWRHSYPEACSFYPTARIVHPASACLACAWEDGAKSMIEQLKGLGDKKMLNILRPGT